MSASTSVSNDLVYFGKLPSRGDFVRSTPHTPLIERLDRWQSQTMERLSADPRWKITYDGAPPVQFAVVGTASPVGLAGQWLASQDTSGRRFPFVTAAAFDLGVPRMFAHLAPVALSRLWARLDQVARVAHAATELEHAQASLHAPVESALHVPTARAAFHDFLETHTVASLEQMLAAGGHRVSVRQATLALGLLLQPAMTQGAARLTKVLRLPLPAEPSLRGVVASWWVGLVLGFFSRHEVELGLYVVQHGGGGAVAAGFPGRISRDLARRARSVDAGRTCGQPGRIRLGGGRGAGRLRPAQAVQLSARPGAVSGPGLEQLSGSVSGSLT